MPFVKLDCGMLDSTLWMDRNSREVFITALLMAEPVEVPEPLKQIAVRTLENTDFVVPPGWYGFVPAAGVGIIGRARLEQEAGLAALERLGAADPESRSREFEGRRLVRVNGGYLVLNYMRYREKDHSGAERAARYRARRKHLTNVTRDGVTVTRDITHADADADADADKKQTQNAAAPLNGARRSSRRCPKDWNPEAADLEKLQVEHPKLNLQRELEKFRDNTFGVARSDWDATFRNWIRRAGEFRGAGTKPHTPAMTTAEAEAAEAARGR